MSAREQTARPDILQCNFTGISIIARHRQISGNLIDNASASSGVAPRKEAIDDSLRALLDPRSIAVVGASQRPGPGARVIANLQAAGFQGEIFAVNPRYTEVLGCRCVAGVGDLPQTVDCLVVAVGAEAACSVLEEAQARGIGAAIVLSAGFGEGGHLESHAERVRAVAESGMRICGPNCFGIVNVRSGAAMFSGVVPRTLIAGPVALVSQSGSLGNFVFSPLMRDRKLGFSHFISCGNQLGTTIEDYAEYLVEDPDVKVIAVILEALKNPRKLSAVARRAHAQEKSMIFCQVGKSNSRPTRHRLAYRRAGGKFRNPAGIPAPLRNHDGRFL